jgi:hypothetical protein
MSDAFVKMDEAKVPQVLITMQEAAEAVKQEQYRKSSELQCIDSEVTDLYHEIELGSYDAVVRLSVYSELRGALIRRRVIKNELELLRVTVDATAHVSSISKTLSKLINKKRTYRPRTNNGIDFKSPKRMHVSRKNKLKEDL